MGTNLNLVPYFAILFIIGLSSASDDTLRSIDENGSRNFKQSSLYRSSRSYGSQISREKKRHPVDTNTSYSKYVLNEDELTNIRQLMKKRRQNIGQRNKRRRAIRRQNRQLKLLLRTDDESASRRIKRETHLLSSEDADCAPLPLQKSRVFLTVNAKSNSKKRLLASARGQRNLEMNWELPHDIMYNLKYNANPSASNYSDDWIGLFKGKPTERETTRLLQRINPIEHPAGYYKTNYKIRRTPNFQTRNDRCVQGFWIAHLRNNSVLRMNCLLIRPRWMWEERDVIGNTPLHSLMLPGTHNSGSFIPKGSSGNLLKRYSAQQEEDVWDQLLYGVRYLDFRVSYHANTAEKFWLNHDLIQMNPLYKAIQDIRRYLSATKEIIIMDFHRFPDGFKNSTMHADLVSYLMQEVGEFMVPDSMGSGVTPNELWAANKTLIVTYGDSATSAFNGNVWPKVEQAWGDARTRHELYAFLTGSMRSRSEHGSKHLWAAMTHLTPTAWQFLSKSSGGFRFLSDSIAREVTKWYRDEWWSSANIVATDFFLGNNIIEESVRSNRRRLKECENVQRNDHSDLFGENKPSHAAFTTEPTTTKTNENDENRDKDSKKTSGWLSWFGF